MESGVAFSHPPGLTVIESDLDDDDDEGDDGED